MRQATLILTAIGGLLLYGASYAFARNAPAGTENDQTAKSDYIPTSGSQPRGIRNKNPLNIKWSKSNNWKGQLGHDKGGFVVFSDPKYGIRAAYKLILAYRNKYGLNTVDKIIKRWSPDANGLSGRYTAAVVDYTKLNPHTPLTFSDDQLAALIKGMIAVECGAAYLNTFSLDTIKASFGA